MFSTIYSSGSQSGLYHSLGGGAIRGKGVLEVGSSECIVPLFMVEVTLDQTLGN
jgi:hypothetical protein